jgi:hypothetical protein
VIHTPCPTLHREIGHYLSFVNEARREIEVSEFATYQAAEARAESIKASNPETPRSGRYEFCDDRLLAEILDHLAGDFSYLDEQVGSVDEAGWYGRIGRFIVEYTDQGFFWYIDHESEPAAEAAFATIEAVYPHSEEDC